MMRQLSKSTGAELAQPSHRAPVRQLRHSPFRGDALTGATPLDAPLLPMGMGIRCLERFGGRYRLGDRRLQTLPPFDGELGGL